VRKVALAQKPGPQAPADAKIKWLMDAVEKIANASHIPDQVVGDFDDHVSDPSAAHAASAISFAPTGNISATDVQGAIAEHIGETADAHDASAISYAGGTGIAATNVEGALDELANEKLDNTTDTLTGVLTITNGAAAGAGNQLVLQPTDFGVNVPGLFIRQNGVGAYLIGTFDGTDTDGTILLNCSSLTHNGIAILNTATGIAQGKHTIWVLAAGMIPQTTNGPALVTTELPTNDVMLRTLDFDQTTVELAQFQIAMPKSWDGGTLTFIPYWTAASGTGTVSWRMNMRAQNDDDALDQDQGTSQASDDTLIAANDLHVGPESAAITPAGTPGDHSLLFCKIRRDTANDTLNADAKLIGVKVFYTVNAATDA
jgi:hypothetical protein